LRRIMIEVLAAQVGQCMGLPCPTPYIVTANPTHVGRPPGRKIIAFGSEQVGRMAYTVMNTDVLLHALNSHRLTEGLCVFDELIANGVRGPRDIVIDPVHGPFVIDHEGAMENGVDFASAVTNWIADRVLERADSKALPQLLKRLRAKAAVLQGFEFNTVPSAVQFDQQGVETYRQLLEFLRARLSELDRLISSRVLPKQAYLQTNEKEDRDASGRAPRV
jgi:hypothetical protein